jgi:thioredoxin-like negative regulator of GroEL
MASSSNLIDITDEAHFESVLSNLPKGAYCVLDFWADWAEQCKQMNDVIGELAKANPELTFLKVGKR